MDLDIFWHRPVELTDGSDDNLILTCDFDKIPQAPGVYTFARKWGDQIEPLYIGQASDLRGRIWQHCNNNVRLMRQIENAQRGLKVVLAAEWRAKPGQQQRRSLNAIEAALIKYALAEGHDLFNVQGTKRPVHTINSAGNRDACAHLFRREIKTEQ
jgi:hypothetical protein